MKQNGKKKIWVTAVALATFSSFCALSATMSRYYSVKTGLIYYTPPRYGLVK